MKQILDAIISCKEEYSFRPILVGLSGLPRSGKTTLIRKIHESLEKRGVPSIIYHGDWDLKRDSVSRKEWIWNSFSGNVPRYIDEINTGTWLDFPRAHHHLGTLLENRSLTIRSYYDRDSGMILSRKIVLRPQNGVILYENVIL